MPHSWHYPTGLFLEHIAAVAPTSIVDIGPGFGKWGFLAREMLDFNGARLDRGDWKVRIDGIDAFPYTSPVLDWVYDEVTCVDVTAEPEEVAGYDLVIMGDVIEHFTKAAGERTLGALRRANGLVLIATPRDFFQQDIADNPFERHLSLWTVEDFTALGADVDVVGGAIVALVPGTAELPRRTSARSSRLVYRTPVLRRGDVGARLAKRVVERARR